MAKHTDAVAAGRGIQAGNGKSVTIDVPLAEPDLEAAALEALVVRSNPASAGAPGFSAFAFTSGKAERCASIWFPARSKMPLAGTRTRTVSDAAAAVPVPRRRLAPLTVTFITLGLRSPR